MNTKLMTDITDENLAADILARTLKAGATDAEVHASDHRALKIDVRNGAMQGARNTEAVNLMLTAYVGKRKATLSTNQTDAASVAGLIDRVMSMARIAPEDAWCGLAAPDLVRVGDDAVLNLADPNQPAPDDLLNSAQAVEAAARAVAGVTLSDGAVAQWGIGRGRHAASNGLSHLSESSWFSFGAAMVAGKSDQRETGAFYRTTRWRADMPALESIGREAGETAAKMLGAQKIDSMHAPVIFDRRVSTQLISPLLQAISGHAIARGTSFVKDRLGKQVLASTIDIVEDPFKLRGLGSRLVDDDGVATRACKLIDRGTLTTWLLDCSSARQLKSKTTGHAGGLSNLAVSPGVLDQAALMRDAGAGLLVTHLFGPSLNPNSGDWSVGVAGYWFENGDIVHPVSEVTVAANLRDIYPELVAGSDLKDHDKANAPSLLVPKMSIGGR